MDVYHAAFPNKAVFINSAPGGSWMRKAAADYAATFDPPIGLKHAGMFVDLDSHQGYGTFTGSWDMIRTYSMTCPIWLESPFGFGTNEVKYWSWLAGLHYHPDAIDVHPDYLTQTSPQMLRWVSAHLKRSVKDTPSVWIALRDSEYEYQSWGDGAVSGKMGDWNFWLTRPEPADGKAVRVWKADLPSEAQSHIFSRQARRTDQASGQNYIYLNVDDGYPYAGLKPASETDGNAAYSIKVIFLNQGTDTISLQYKNYRDQMVSQTLRKGSGLGPLNTWVTYTFDLTDGYLNNNLGNGQADFRISSNGDGNETVHFVEVVGRWNKPMTPTITPTSTPTPILQKNQIAVQEDTFISQWYS